MSVRYLLHVFMFLSIAIGQSSVFCMGFDKKNAVKSMFSLKGRNAKIIASLLAAGVGVGVIRALIKKYKASNENRVIEEEVIQKIEIKDKVSKDKFIEIESWNDDKLVNVLKSEYNEQSLLFFCFNKSSDVIQAEYKKIIDANEKLKNFLEEKRFVGDRYRKLIAFDVIDIRKAIQNFPKHDVQKAIDKIFVINDCSFNGKNNKLLKDLEKYSELVNIPIKIFVCTSALIVK